MREEKYHLSLVRWEENNPKWLAYLKAHDPEDNFFIEELLLTTKARDGIYDPYGNKVEGLIDENDERLSSSYIWMQFNYPMQHTITLRLNWHLDWNGAMTSIARKHLPILDFHAKGMLLSCQGVLDFSYLCNLSFIDFGVNVHLLEIRQNKGYEAIELLINDTVKIVCNSIDITVTFMEESDITVLDKE